MVKIKTHKPYELFKIQYGLFKESCYIKSLLFMYDCMIDISYTCANLSLYIFFSLGIVFLLFDLFFTLLFGPFGRDHIWK